MTPDRRPVSFLATAQPEAALAFYGGTLGLTLIEDTPFALVFEDVGQVLRIQKVPVLTPVAHTVYGWLVPDIDNEVRMLGAKGVKMLTYEHVPQDASGIWTTPNGDRIAWLADPCGNILSLTQRAAR